MWWLLACADAPPQDSTLASGVTRPVSEVEETATAAITSPEAFTLGEVHPCGTPTVARWADEAPVTDYEAPTEIEPPILEPGGVALVGTRLYWLRDGGRVLTMDLGDGVVAEPDWPAEIAGLAIADLDGDGIDDLILAGITPAIVRGPGTTGEALVLLDPGTDLRWVRDITPGDVDGDGDADLVYSYSGTAEPTFRAPEVRLNDGAGTFAAPTGIVADIPWGHPFDANLLDLDGDADPDLYQCNDLGYTNPNAVLLNDGAGTYTPGGAGWGLDLAMNCMGSVWGDADADGDLDAYFSDTFRHYLLLDMGGLWVDVSASRGLAELPERGMAWGASLVDADNDGLPDLAVAISDFWVRDAARHRIALLHQDADGGYVDRGALPTEADGRGMVTTDLNGDGVVDFVIGDARRSPRVLRSEGCTDASWIEVEAPPGSRVRVDAGDRSWVALVTHESGFASAGPTIAHIGLGDADIVDRIVVSPWWGSPVAIEGQIDARRRVTWRP